MFWKQTISNVKNEEKSQEYNEIGGVGIYFSFVIFIMETRLVGLMLEANPKQNEKQSSSSSSSTTTTQNTSNIKNLYIVSLLF